MSEAPLRLGLFGGSFDPVHNGHLHVARAAGEAFHLDRIAFVPAARSPFKLGRALAPGEDRLAMLEIAIRGEPAWTISDIELRRGGTSYTVDTVRELPGALGLPGGVRIHLLIGDDNLEGLPLWIEVEELLRLARPVVVRRFPGTRRILEGLRGRLSEAALARLAEGFLEVPPVPWESTELRRALAAGGDLPRGLRDALPEGVLEYIRRRGIYLSEGPARE